MTETPRKKESTEDIAIILACAIIPIIILLIGLKDGHSYGYFTFLRIVVFVGALVYAALCSKAEQHLLQLVFLFFTFLYNPFIPIHLNRDIWIIINVITITMFIGGLVAWFHEYRINNS